MLALQPPKQPELPLSPTRVTQRKGKGVPTTTTTDLPDEPTAPEDEADAGGLGAAAAALRPRRRPLPARSASPSPRTVRRPRGCCAPSSSRSRDEPSASLQPRATPWRSPAALTSQQVAKACSICAEALCRTGKVPEAFQSAQRALALVKDDPAVPAREVAGVRCNLAALLCVRGRFVEAERELHAALGADPSCVSAFRNLLWVYLRTGRGPAAMQVVQTRRGVAM